MAVLSPIQYRLSLLKETLFGDGEILYEVLVCYQDKLPSTNMRVLWRREGDYIVGTIFIGGEEYVTQAQSAQEFVEMVNDAIYAAYEIPPKYIRHLGGHYRLMPSKEEFAALNDIAIKESSFNFEKSKALA